MKRLISLLFVCIAIVCIFTSCNENEFNVTMIDFNDYVKISFIGYNGEGSLQGELDKEQFLLDNINNVFWNPETYHVYVDIYGEPEKSAAYEILQYISADVDVQHNLSNGDMVTLSWSIDQQVEDYFVVKYKADNKIFTVSELKDKSENNEIDEHNSIYSQFDYASMWINKNKGVSIESFYADDEERFFAMQLIGTVLPKLKYLDSDEHENTINNVFASKYIIWFIEPDGAYCNKMITIVDAYRETENALPVIGLSIKDGDITAFNKEGENAFHLVNKDDVTNDLVELIVWVPTFLYVENGKVQLVTFGLMDDAKEINKNIDIAFN